MADPFIVELLDDEAGISAYMQAAFTINLNDVRGSFTTIELETASYIIGSIHLPGYPEAYDPHVYVHIDGWILAYYLDQDPASKIVDLHSETLNSTLLEDAISIIANAAGVPVTDVYFYNFHYPNATHMMFIAEDFNNGDSFSITATSSYAYFEHSWSVWRGPSNAYFVFDGVNKLADNPSYNDSQNGYGYISTSEFTLDVEHWVAAKWYGALVLLYRVP
jgi:hypothetical protein